jgi:hypothetical protein
MRASLHVTLFSPSPGAGPIHKCLVNNSEMRSRVRQAISRTIIF